MTAWLTASINKTILGLPALVIFFIIKYSFVNRTSTPNYYLILRNTFDRFCHDIIRTTDKLLLVVTVGLTSDSPEFKISGSL